MSKAPIILIPSYRPDQKLVNTLKELRFISSQPIVVVDDGNTSTSEKNLFLKLSNLKDVHIVHHAENRGKGAALKTGFKYILNHFPEAVGVVTADADGQHSPSDVLKVSEQLLKTPEALVLGMREFSGDDVPFRSRFGNEVTAFIFKLSTGISCPDTQTGLRGLSRQEMIHAMAVKGDRFEYEMNQLLDSARRKTTFTRVPIETIYIDDNATSHYNPIKDSIKILSAIFKFMLASSVGTVVDLSLFFLLAGFAFPATVTGILWATVISRVISGIVNYTINVKWVFGSKNDKGTFLRYGLLFLGLMALSAILVAGTSQVFGYHFFLKLIIDTFLFIISYKVQQEFVFKPQQRLPLVKTANQIRPSITQKLG
ncbi:bifunctional glycosyltransferase family 2/GtrA family protein [Streptococcus moroccensis]|uniref:Glycosyltransferase involved in cell wall biosynthesis n=1 Tax=Streptococcus moroccensis TaxID=1451356 RepID=A0ABT9YTL1_9STRE|nr:bifunctional glycosyltransferase family 2/GtrA family protein [Streptococcus moroccensis]MDQ0223232.1 glycosyltransferase involved in cell wall biosynthesis [Streptococcus moroccensis]